MNREEQLIKACLKGKRSACKELYELHSAKLMAVCLRYTSDTTNAEDILQDGFIKIFKDLKDYKPVAPLYAWMRTVIVRTALEHIRKHRKNQQKTEGLSDRAQTIGINEQVSAELERQELLKIVQALPDKLRTVFNLHAIEGYSHMEIAQLLNISESNSKVRMNRARKELQERLENRHQKEERWNSMK